nr:MetaGeneMark_Unknown Function [uncultured bacterium]
MPLQQAIQPANDFPIEAQ